MKIRAFSLALLVPAALVAGCAGLGRPSHFGLDAHHAATVRQTCSEIMGLQPSAEYAACGNSLAQHVLALQGSLLVTQAEAQCRDRGHAPDTVEMAKCVVLSRSREGQQVVGAVPAGGELPAKHYLVMDSREQRLRAELSCAQIGLHPAWASFDSCVTNLSYAVADARNWPGP